MLKTLPSCDIAIISTLIVQKHPIAHYQCLILYLKYIENSTAIALPVKTTLGRRYHFLKLKLEVFSTLILISFLVAWFLADIDSWSSRLFKERTCSFRKVFSLSRVSMKVFFSLKLERNWWSSMPEFISETTQLNINVNKNEQKNLIRQ